MREEEEGGGEKKKKQKIEKVKRKKEKVERKRGRLDRMRDGRQGGTCKLQQLLFSPKLLTRAIFSVHPPEKGASLLQSPDQNIRHADAGRLSLQGFCYKNRSKTLICMRVDPR